MWLKIMISAPQTLSDIISGYLATLTGSGTEIITPKNSGPEPASQEMIVGYLLDDAKRQTQEESLKNFLNDLQINSADKTELVMQTELIKEEDWGKTWKKFFKPKKITQHLVIKPTWEAYTPNPEERVIELDPGMAFGTGHHASTNMALHLIEDVFLKNTPPPRKVLDVGTGTGILGIASCLFGAEVVLALDNDPDAIAAARENVKKNNLLSKVTASDQELNTLTDSYELVIANITHDTLVLLAPHLVKSMADDGFLILAGILKDEQEQSIINFYANLGLTPIQTRYMDEWVALTFKKKI
jgi:ribosomal protein L11 methyltransferase